MKKSVAKIGSVLLAASLGIMGFASPAHADSCVSKAEYGKIKTGMTLAAVKALTGTNGTSIAASGKGAFRVESRNYKACTAFGAVSIVYMGGKVQSKAGIF